jgi:serine/threonine protein kinase/tetratricopeptide (TPR) repeat protein
MGDQRLQRVDEVFQAAIDLPPDHRAGFLESACLNDDELRVEVESLLSAHEEAGDFIEEPPSDVAASLFQASRPKQVGPYIIEKLLGAGGMGEVYLAEDTRLNRKVAIKFLTPNSLDNEQANRRLLQEARAAAKLDHPNVCAIYEVGESDPLYIVMPYVEGETLDVKMKQSTLGLPAALKVATQVADAVAEAHAQNIIHRDIKPANIIMTSRGQAKVMDFGLAKITTSEPMESEARKKSLLTTPGMIMGTLPYMSPEQVKGEKVDARSDIFSFGVLVYEMLTGKQPFACDSAAATAAAILTTDPVSLCEVLPNAPKELQRIVHKCLEKDRQRRYQTMQDVASDLHNAHELKTEENSRRPPTEIAPSQNSSARLPNPARQSTRLSRPLRATAAALIVTVIAGTLIFISYRRQAPISSTSPIKSLAVLPLNNLSGDATQEYFADGMTEAVIAGLGRISALRVISRTSVMQYKASRKSLPEIADELKVDAIVEGSVQRSGDRVRITVQLIRAATDQPFWTQTYDRELRDVLAFQSEVAGAITREIQIKLTPQEQARLSIGRTVDSEAYDYYLRGKSHAAILTDSENQTAIEMLEHAVALDPSFAIAFAELARAYTRRLNSFAPEEKQWEQKAFTAIEKALSLDADLAEAHLARGLLLWTHANHFPHERVIQEYRAALSLNPNLDEAHHQLCVVYLHIGLFDEALQEIQTAVAINPSNTYAQYRVGMVYLYQGRAEEALAVFRKYQATQASAYSDYQTIWALSVLGRRGEAWKSVEESRRQDSEDPAGAMNSAAAMLAVADGDRRKAEDLIGTALRGKEKGFIHFHHTAYNIACAYALMNRPQQAIEWLQKAADDGLPCYSLFANDHNLDNLRQDPRFITFLAKQKEQWEYYKTRL